MPLTLCTMMTRTQTLHHDQTLVPFSICSSLVVVAAQGFMGVGGTTNGVTGGVTAGADPVLRKVFFRSFFDAVSRGVPVIQLGSGSIMGTRIHNSTWLLAILKGQLGFQGVVLSAYRGVEALEGEWAGQVRAGVNVGIDMFVVGRNKYSAFISTLKKEVEAGRVPVSRIDDAVRRVLAMKVEAGLFHDPCGTRGLDLKTVGSEEHRKLARRCERRSGVVYASVFVETCIHMYLCVCLCMHTVKFTCLLASHSHSGCTHVV